MGRGLELIAWSFTDSQHFTAMGLPNRGKQDSIHSKLFFELGRDVLSSGGDNDPIVRRMLQITEFAVPVQDGDIGDSGFSEVSSSENGQFFMTFNGHHLFCQQAQQSSVVSQPAPIFRTLCSDSTSSSRSISITVVGCEMVCPSPMGRGWSA